MSRIIDTSRRSPGEPDPSPARAITDRKGNADVGVVSYFHIHDAATVERVVAGLERMGVTHVRSAVSWCDWETDGGPEWYEWVLDQLCSRFTVLPCVLYTPPAKGMLPKTSSPPRDPNDYADFVDLLLSTYAGRFEYVELWNEPNNYIEWDWTVDPEWIIFAKMIAAASARAHSHGVKTVLGGMSPLDPNWLNLMFERDALNQMDVIGIHGFPGTWEAVWEGWSSHIDRVQEVLDRHSSNAQVWITECGFSTWAHDEFRQLQTLIDVMDAPVPRAYWYSAEDLDDSRETLDGFHCDERAYHFGLHRRDGSPKLIARIWGGGGLEAVRAMNDLAPAPDRPGFESDATLVTGGAGTIGSALVDRLAGAGRKIVVLDNLSRAGSEGNVRRLKERWGQQVRIEIADVRDPFAVRRSLVGCDQVFHLAAPTTDVAIADPPLDLAVTLQGTMNVLEEIRRLDVTVPLVFASTLDVYEPSPTPEPIDETRQISFQGLSATSKGGADQYVLRYGSIFGFHTVVFRLGFVGPDHPVLPPGEVRDVLDVQDAVDALIVGMEHHEVLAGNAYNIGGGADRRIGQAAEPGEARHLIADFSAFSSITGWKPVRSLGEPAVEPA